MERDKWEVGNIFAARESIVRIDSATDDTIRVSLTVAIRFTDASVNRYTPKYRKSHCGDKTISRQSYLHNGISYTGKRHLCIELVPCFQTKNTNTNSLLADVA